MVDFMQRVKKMMHGEKAGKEPKNNDRRSRHNPEHYKEQQIYNPGAFGGNGNGGIIMDGFKGRRLY
ncbi:hypothetical protein LR48_Vigan635s006600 [Vigna angularis]|uniref:Uncharacterized protein n=1 Tax=Phaseolus angularis TaxID=3914 RepID=A0A0L9TFD9_PHAAN|nr:uncharacterized protein HKW66_Vig0091500 [Vigna angularis]KOM29141.1 hypothetical protein LR48_Vigan635s006600 [Vigna angularis]